MDTARKVFLVFMIPCICHMSGMKCDNDLDDAKYRYSSIDKFTLLCSLRLQFYYFVSETWKYVAEF